MPVTKTLSQAIELFRYKWSIFMAVLCVDEQGNKYMKSNIAICPEPYLQRDLVDFLNTEHQKLIAGANKSQMVGGAWLASAVGRDFNEEEAFNIFDKLGAWK